MNQRKASQCHCHNKKYFNLKFPCPFELSVFIVETLSQQVKDAPSGSMVVPRPANSVWLQLPIKTLLGLCLRDFVDRRHHCWHPTQTVSYWCKFAAVNQASGQPWQDERGKWAATDRARQIKNGKTWGIYLKTMCFYYNSKHSVTRYFGTPPFSVSWNLRLETPHSQTCAHTHTHTHTTHTYSFCHDGYWC